MCDARVPPGTDIVVYLGYILPVLAESPKTQRAPDHPVNSAHVCASGAAAGGYNVMRVCSGRVQQVRDPCVY